MEQPSARAGRDGDAPVNVVHGIPADEVERDDPDAKLYTSEPVEADDGTMVVVQQQNAAGKDNIDGHGEWPDPDEPPARITSDGTPDATR
jgi:hypothetical protein